MEKTAVDATAKKYWEDYFKEYGQMWVRNIPRRIKSAVRMEMKAEKIEGSLVPLAYEVSPDGTLSLEAAFNGMLDNKFAKVLITAEFNEDGILTSFEPTRII